MDTDIILTGFHIKDSVIKDLLIPIIALDKKIIVHPGGGRRLPRLITLHDVTGAVYGLQESLRPDWLYQVIQHIQLKPFQRKMGIGRSDDDQRRILQPTE